MGVPRSGTLGVYFGESMANHILLTRDHKEDIIKGLSYTGQVPAQETSTPSEARHSEIRDLIP